MTFAMMQNLVLYRLRLFGANFVAANSNPINATTNYDPPSLVKMMINQGYQEFLSACKDFPIATVKVSCATLGAAQRQISLSPLPNGVAADGTAIRNAAVMRIYRMTYYEGSYSSPRTPLNYPEKQIPLVSTERFARMTGGFTARQGTQGSIPYFASQLDGSEDWLDVYPSLNNTGDIFTVTFTPDPQKTFDVYQALGTVSPPASLGGQLNLPGDIPLIPSQFHMALVDYAVMNMGDAHDRMDAVAVAAKKWQAALVEAEFFGASRGGGDVEQWVHDPWTGLGQPTSDPRLVS